MKQTLYYYVEAFLFFALIGGLEFFKVDIFNTKGLLLVVAFWTVGHIMIKRGVNRLIQNYENKRKLKI